MSMLTGLKVSSLTCKCVFYRTELNVKGGGGDPIELILKVLTLNKPKDRKFKEEMKKWGHLSSYHVYFQNYGL